MFAEKTKSVLLLGAIKCEKTIYFVNNGFDYQLLLNQSGFDYPLAITYREALDRYFGVFIPQDKPLKLMTFANSILTMEDAKAIR